VNGKTAAGKSFRRGDGSGAGGNQIGGTNSGAGNVISGNINDGILLTGGAAEI